MSETNWSLKILCLLLVTGYQPKNSIQSVEWRRGENSAQLQSLDMVDTELQTKLGSYQQEVEFKVQTINNVPIDSSYLKQIRGADGDLLIVRGAVVREKSSAVLSQITIYEKSRAQLEMHLKKALPKLRYEKLELILVPKGNSLEPQWKVVYADKLGQLWDLRMNNYLQIKSVVRAGSSFHDTPAVVFPRGPKMSQLQEVLFKGLIPSNILTNENVSVQSDVAIQELDISKPLVFSAQDARFDVVQTFYFLNESLNWFEKKLQVKLPFKLDAKIHLGAPEKTNSAFYYQGNIRIGSGDDEVYSRLPQDPTVVIHESVHAVVDAIAHLPFQGEGGSINEGYADFFTALQLDNPKLGEASYLKGPFRRTVAVTTKISEKNGGLYHDSGIVSGVLWNLKEVLGVEITKALAIKTLNRLVPASDLVDFGRQLKDVIQESLKDQELRKAVQILEQRGLG